MEFKYIDPTIQPPLLHFTNLGEWQLELKNPFAIQWVVY